MLCNYNFNLAFRKHWTKINCIFKKMILQLNSEVMLMYNLVYSIYTNELSTMSTAKFTSNAGIYMQARTCRHAHVGTHMQSLNWRHSRCSHQLILNPLIRECQGHALRAHICIKLAAILWADQVGGADYSSVCFLIRVDVLGILSVNVLLRSFPKCMQIYRQTEYFYCYLL